MEPVMIYHPLYCVTAVISFRPSLGLELPTIHHQTVKPDHMPQLCVLRSQTTCFLNDFQRDGNFGFEFGKWDFVRHDLSKGRELNW